jgi:hypothetical protein
MPPNISADCGHSPVFAAYFQVHGFDPKPGLGGLSIAKLVPGWIHLGLRGHVRAFKAATCRRTPKPARNGNRRVVPCSVLYFCQLSRNFDNTFDYIEKES